MLQQILFYVPLAVAPIILLLFVMISAYVFKFRVPRSGLGFDYVIFALLVIIGLYLGGAI